MEDKVKDILAVCQARRLKGKETYGQNAFRSKNNIKETIEELEDAINYMLFQIILLKELDENIRLQGTACNCKSVRKKTNKVLSKSTGCNRSKRLKEKKEVAKARH